MSTLPERRRWEPSPRRNGLNLVAWEQWLPGNRCLSGNHGHAHNGTPEGRTTTGIPDYNVSLPLMRRTFLNRPPFRILELATEQVGPG